MLTHRAFTLLKLLSLSYDSNMVGQISWNFLKKAMVSEIVEYKAKNIGILVTGSNLQIVYQNWKSFIRILSFRRSVLLL